jgi:L-lactate dehydrogenase complex protein LldF
MPKSAGANIYQARDGAEAIAYCLALAARHGAKTVAKSKSLTTEEISLNHPLQEAGIEVVETDLGELIIQLANEKPFHLVFPSIHKMAPDVAELFAKATGKEVPAEIPAIMRVVRNTSGRSFLNTEIGLTGANIGIAETGGICIETNEGNGRLVSSLGNCHICVIGMEKIVESIEDALLMVLAHPVSASGQLPTTYVTWMHGRSPLGEGEAATVRESHIIILDNGRSRCATTRPARGPVLHPLCGACMNICPTYGVVGGHTFGYIYPARWASAGPPGCTAWNAPPISPSSVISCGLCKEICPAKINMPHMIAEIKHRDAASNGHLVANRVMMAADKAARLGSAVAPLANAVLANGMLRVCWKRGLVSRRNANSLLLPRHLSCVASAGVSRGSIAPRRQVALFVDVYANYNNPELGLKAVDALERLGCKVIVPNQEVSGYPYIAYGGMDQARRIARSNSAKLAPWVHRGYDVVAIEPTAAYALAVSYPVLTCGAEDARLLAEHTFELFEYLNRLEDETGQVPDPDLLTGRRLGFHCACHQRPLGGGQGAIDWLRRRGADRRVDRDRHLLRHGRHLRPERRPARPTIFL